MADDAVLAVERSAILERMLTGCIDVAGDAHEGRLPRPEPVPPGAHPRMTTGDGECDIATFDAVRATTEHVICSFLTSGRTRTEYKQTAFQAWHVRNLRHLGGSEREAAKASRGYG